MKCECVQCGVIYDSAEFHNCTNPILNARSESKDGDRLSKEMAPFATQEPYTFGENCKSCYYVHKRESTAQHECRRYPPSINNEGFPMVDRNMWCGEYK